MHRAPAAAIADEVRARLAADGLEPSTWSNGPNDRYAPHRHDYDKVLVAADGSIVFELPDVGAQVGLERGDRLDLPSGTVHSAVVGPTGVVCLEAHLPAGQLGSRHALHVGWATDSGRPETAPEPEA